MHFLIRNSTSYPAVKCDGLGCRSFPVVVNLFSWIAASRWIVVFGIVFYLVFSQSVYAQPFCDQAQPGAGFPSDPLCEAAVCVQDIFCCFNSWDAICADIAATLPACVNCIQGGGGGGGSNNLCPTCDNPCGDAQGFATAPTIDEVVANCESEPFTPVLAPGSLNTFCYSFTATATSVDFQVIITSDCVGGNVTNFSWALYDAICGAPIQTGTLASLTFSPVDIGNNYVFCYTFSVPFSCTHEIHCPYFVGAEIEPCPTAEINYPQASYCGSDNNTYAAELSGSGAFGGGSYTTTPVGLTIDPATGEIIPGSSTPGEYTIFYTIPATTSCDEVVTTAEVTIEDVLMPEFDSVGPFCTGSLIPPLPETSNNGVSGNWSPAINNNTTTTYTFTPSAGQCAEIITIEIEIDSEIEPNFDEVGPFCAGDDIPVLPDESNNGITGTWTPEIDNSATTTYTFAPDDGQCGIATTLQIVVDEVVDPDFNAVGPYCEGANISDLPSVSNNGISGSWSPEISNTATTIYTFTPEDGQCTDAVTLEIVINQQIEPEFEPVGPFCAGSDIPELPTSSLNGISGSWSPEIDNNNTTTYSFTPNADECASTLESTIVIDDEVEPEFDIVGPYCQGANIPSLPTTSLNNVNGTWSPEIDNSDTNTYTFTPNDGQCGAETTLEILIDPEIIPSFNPVDAYCLGEDIPALPEISNNGVSGSWSPDIDNTATTTYTFTPDDGQCGAQTTLNITVIENETVIIPIQACDEYTWPLNGESYNQSGEHAVLLESSLGCDSTVVLSLTINESQSSTVEHTSCESYLWNGQLYSENGIYITENQTSEGCTSLDTLLLTILPSAGPVVVPVEICPGEEYQIGNNWYSTSGTYNEYYTAANGCDSIVQVQLTVLPEPHAQYTATPAVATVFDEYIQFNSESTYADSLFWDFGDFGTFNTENPVLNFEQKPGRYSFCITVWSEEGCSNQNCFTFVVRDEFNVYIPNAFSPNEDGINDLFFVEGTGIDPNDFQLQIFNRWGDLVFETHDITVKWNGESPGRDHYAQNEVFVYHLIVGAENSMEKREFRGTATVIR